MGQQIAFETIETVVRGLTASRGSDRPIVDTRFVKFGDDTMWRAEFDHKTSSGSVQRVHLYEVYWAPLQNGSASPTWATTPAPKKDGTRARVRSKRSSGTVRCPGA